MVGKKFSFLLEAILKDYNPSMRELHRQDIWRPSSTRNWVGKKVSVFIRYSLAFLLLHHSFTAFSSVKPWIDKNTFCIYASLRHIQSHFHGILNYKQRVSQISKKSSWKLFTKKSKNMINYHPRQQASNRGKKKRDKIRVTEANIPYQLCCDMS